MKKIVLLIIILCSGLTSCLNDQKTNEKSDRMAWWEEARFGMFIHWGLYAVPAGEWQEGKNHAEWIRTTAQIPLETYNQFVQEFNPVKFNAKEWVSMAKNAGMKYIVITSKHHDGFCLFDSKHTDFDIMSTPFKRDIMKELADACHDQGVKICWYHSIMDWHHPDYLPRRNWETNRSAENANFDRYVDYMKNQLQELCSNYGEIGVLWFDGEWENTWTHEKGKDLYKYVRSLGDNIIVNNRVDKGRKGMEGLSKGSEFKGDFGTPEQQIPATGIPGVKWESCMTMNDHWGYNKYDKNFKSTTDLVRKLVDIASKGGNFLLNVGPKADGTFPKESIDRLEEMGKWMDIYSESIYGTMASPFESLSWGRCTQKSDGKNTLLYLHVFDWPEDGILKLKGLDNRIKSVEIITNKGNESLKYQHQSMTTIIELPENPVNEICSVIKLKIKGQPEIIKAPVFKNKYTQFIHDIHFEMETRTDLEIRYTKDGSEPDKESELYTKPVKITESCILKAAFFKKGKLKSGTAEMNFDKVKPIAGIYPEQLKPGLNCLEYNGEWDEMPDFEKLPINKKSIKNEIYVAPTSEIEKKGIQYQGYINVEEEGMYFIHLSSDDGSILSINDQILINNDGLHAELEKSACIALGKGYHKFELSYFEKSGGNMLSLKYSIDNENKQNIPSGLFYH